MARIIKNNLGNFLIICFVFLLVFISVLFLDNRQIAFGNPDTSEMIPTSADYCVSDDCSSPTDITSKVDTDNDGNTQDLNGKNSDSARVDAWSYSQSVSGTINSAIAYCNFSSSDPKFRIRYKWCDNSVASDCNDDTSLNWSSNVCESADNPTDTSCDLKANGVDTANEVNNLWIKCIGYDSDAKGPDHADLDYMHVTVDFTAAAGGSLTLSNLTNIQWGDAASGTTKNGTINCTITTTGTTYDVKVDKNQDLTSGANTIASTNFTYTSGYNSGTPSSGVTYQTSSAQFAATPGTNVASMSSGTAADNLNINVNYTLVIPPDQAAASNYTATHTYTLTAS